MNSIVFNILTISLTFLGQILTRNTISSTSTPNMDCVVAGETGCYRGNRSLTNQGEKCEEWDKQSHAFNSFFYPDAGLTNNYCRNPDGDIWPWCFTNATEKKWSYCDVEECANEALYSNLSGCYYSGEAEKYRGVVAMTTSGYPCQFWDKNNPKQHSFKSYLYPNKGLGHHNFCRSPDNDSTVWCVSTRPGHLWEYCDVPLCNEYNQTNVATEKPQNTSFLCGNPEVAFNSENSLKYVDNKRIIGGSIAAKGSIPWQVALFMGDPPVQKCGASIIDKNWIMTAAHCVVHGREPFKYYGIAGVTKANRREKHEVTLIFQKIIVHRKYSSFTLKNDIALFKLNETLKFNKFIKPVCLPPSSSTRKLNKGEKVLVTGWGRTDEYTASYPNELMQVYVPLVSQKRCFKAYGRDILRGMFCAGYLKNEGKDSCLGDSGGPLINPTTYEQIGIVSWGEGCAQPGKPGVYTHVPSYSKWIKRTMRKN